MLLVCDESGVEVNRRHRSSELRRAAMSSVAALWGDTPRRRPCRLPPTYTDLTFTIIIAAQGLPLYAGPSGLAQGLKRSKPGSSPLALRRYPAQTAVGRAAVSFLSLVSLGVFAVLLLWSLLGVVGFAVVSGFASAACFAFAASWVVVGVLVLVVPGRFWSWLFWSVLVVGVLGFRPRRRSLGGSSWVWSPVAGCFVRVRC